MSQNNNITFALLNGTQEEIAAQAAVTGKIIKELWNFIRFSSYNKELNVSTRPYQNMSILKMRPNSNPTPEDAKRCKELRKRLCQETDKLNWLKTNHD